MGEVGCYTMDLYCDADDRMTPHSPAHFAQYTGPSYRSCARQARSDGWRIKDTVAEGTVSGTGQGSGFCLCPGHNNTKGRASRKRSSDTP